MKLNVVNVFTVILFFGVYLFAGSFIVRPLKKAEEAISRGRFEPKNFTTLICRKIQTKIYPHIKISEHNEIVIQSYLMSEKLNITAKDFITYNYAQSIFVLMIGAFFCIAFMSWLPIPVFLFLAVFNYKQQEDKIAKRTTKMRKDVERDAAKFCGIISGKLKSTNNIETIITSFLPIANESMQMQLEITLADMRTGDAHSALTRLERRVSSRRLGEITRGLKAIANGDNQEVYFQVKEQEFLREQKSILEKEIEERTSRLTPIQITMVAMFVVCVFYAFGSVAFTYARELFSRL